MTPSATTADSAAALVAWLSALSRTSPWQLGVGWALLTLGFAWVGATVFLLLWAIRREARGPADAVVVPGAAITPDGELTRVFALRVRAAAALVQRGDAPILVVSGAGGEAEAGAAAAERLGVPRDRILLERNALTTVENAGYTRLLLPRARRVIVVSNTSHLLRCQRCFLAQFPDVAPHDAGFCGWRLAFKEVLAHLRHPRRLAAWRREQARGRLRPPGLTPTQQPERAQEGEPAPDVQTR